MPWLSYVSPIFPYECELFENGSFLSVLTVCISSGFLKFRQVLDNKNSGTKANLQMPEVKWGEWVSVCVRD